MDCVPLCASSTSIYNVSIIPDGVYNVCICKERWKDLRRRFHNSNINNNNIKCKEKKKKNRIRFLRTIGKSQIIGRIIWGKKGYLICAPNMERVCVATIREVYFDVGLMMRGWWYECLYFVLLFYYVKGGFYIYELMIVVGWRVKVNGCLDVARCCVDAGYRHDRYGKASCFSIIVSPLRQNVFLYFIIHTTLIYFRIRMSQGDWLSTISKSSQFECTQYLRRYLWVFHANIFGDIGSVKSIIFLSNGQVFFKNIF